MTLLTQKQRQALIYINSEAAPGQTLTQEQIDHVLFITAGEPEAVTRLFKAGLIIVRDPQAFQAVPYGITEAGRTEAVKEITV